MSVAATAQDIAEIDVLVARWGSVPPGAGGDRGRAHMELALRLLEEALARHLPRMDAADASLYESLLMARDADELSALFCRCFDLMVRMRGTSEALPRMYQLFRLLQPHISRGDGQAAGEGRASRH